MNCDDLERCLTALISRVRAPIFTMSCRRGLRIALGHECIATAREEKPVVLEGNYD